MAETALNFGPDWIRALASGSQGAEAAPTTMSVPRYKLAEHRYGREEMLGLIPKHPRAPESLKQFEHLAKHNFQIPLALTPMTEEEQYLWTSRYLNSEASLRGKTGPGGYGMNRTGRGGSVDRGRGRGRGGYYQRGMGHEELPEGPPFPRQKTIERSLSANEKDHRWDERDRRYDRTYSGRGGNDDSYLKHDNTRGPHEHWRKYDDEGDWRSGGSRSYDKLAGRGSWRSERDRRDPLDHRNQPQTRGSGGNTRGSASPQQRQGSHSSWKDASQGHLPEWSVEEVAEPDTVGTFDSSGAFLETKVSEEDTSQEEIYVSDDADEGSTNQDSPEATKESSKKTPKKPANKPSANTKNNSKSPSEAKNLEEKGMEEVSTPPKSTPKGARGKSKEKQQSPEPKSPPKNSESSPVKQTSKATNPVKTPKGDPVGSRDSKNLENASTTEEDTFAYHQKATENMVAQWTEEIEQRVSPQSEEASLPTHQEKDSKWFYQDPQGEIQGPFASHEMLEWFSSGYFTMSLMVRRSFDETFSQLGDLIKSWGRVPFMPGTSPPPIRASALPSPLTAPIAPTITPNIPAAPPGGQIPKPDEQLLQLQQQLFQQQLMQQQLMLRQAQMQQLLTQLKTQDNFASLSSQQQQQVLMQQFMAQIPRPGLKPMGDPSNLMDPMSALAHPLMGMPLPPMMKSDLWQTAPEAGPWPVNVTTPQPPGGSIWDVDLTKSNETTDIETQNKLAEEQEKIRKAEELRLQQERELEEQRNREELRRKQEEEEERKRIEEIRRQEAERQLKEELKRLEEQRLREEAERQQQEELRRRKKEEEKRKKEEEELKRLEEHRRKEEERRQQEEAKRLVEMRKAEEKRKKEEIQRQKEQEKLLEVERQRELLRQKEAEREERQLREKREREEAELRKLAELKIKTQGPVWGIQKSQSSSDAPLSLADIQRIQEEKEREEREEKMRQQMLQQQAVKQVQVVKNGLTWAKRANDCSPVVKSLSEIQQEEAERLAQLSRMQKPLAPAPPVNSNAGVWGNSSHLNKITAAPSGWNVGNHSMTGGFWDDALSSTQPKKQPPPKSSDNAFPSLVLPAKPASSNKSKNARAKKDEDAVSRLFGSHHKPTDEFTKWCTDAISSMPSSVDVPTFVAFLKDIESPYEVYDYVKSYFGEGKEPREFAKLFLEKRSKYRNQAKQAPTEDNSLWGPAPAITPTVNKPPAPPNNDTNDGGFVVKGKSKKKKGKMQRLDSSMLGFTVQPSPDRVNAGEIDHVDHNV